MSKDKPINSLENILQAKATPPNGDPRDAQVAAMRAAGIPSEQERQAMEQGIVQNSFEPLPGGQLPEGSKPPTPKQYILNTLAGLVEIPGIKPEYRVLIEGAAVAISAGDERTVKVARKMVQACVKHGLFVPEKSKKRKEKDRKKKKRR